jgi:hypothetical protein
MVPGKDLRGSRGPSLDAPVVTNSRPAERLVAAKPIGPDEWRSERHLLAVTPDLSGLLGQMPYKNVA